jgi:signal transduction histidine kinase
VDAVPRFDPLGGRYIGHLGRSRRPALTAAAPATPPVKDSETTASPIVCELRTPVNAIQGFAEVIQQQLFGPTRMNIGRLPRYRRRQRGNAGRV